MSFIEPIESVEETLKVDVGRSAINWKGYKPTGSHYGTIQLQAGSIEWDGKKLIGGSFKADMSTIEESERTAKLERHLKSADFFEIEQYPIASFEITETLIKDGKTLITGQLTIKNVTKEISFLATLTESEGAVILTSETFQLNRAEFNVKYKSKTFFNDLKEKFIYDNFDLQITIVANTL